MDYQFFATAVGQGKAPSEFRVFPYGEFELEGRPVVRATVDKESMDAIVSDFARRGNDMMIDYEHQSVKASTGSIPAAGWVTKLINKGKDGLWASVNWTQKAKAHLENREYRFFSPCFTIRRTDNKVMSLVNIALTNMPRTNHITPLVASMTYHSGHIQVISEDQKRLNDMLGIDAHEWLEAAAGVEIPQDRMFETDEEKLKKMLGDL